MDSSKRTDFDESIAVIKSGLNIKSDFWEDFIRICGNDGLSKLLDVPKEKIANWGAKINEVLEHIKKMDDGDSINQKTQPI